jgi:hypothetical protein
VKYGLPFICAVHCPSVKVATAAEIHLPAFQTQGMAEVRLPLKYPEQVAKVVNVAQF